MIRSILAVLAGFILITVLSVGADAALQYTMPDIFGTSDNTNNPTGLALALTYVFAFSVLGCYVTARLAPKRPMKHAMILGVIGLVLAIPVHVGIWSKMPAWYHIIALLIVLPTAWTGGRWREFQLRQESIA